MKKQFDYLIVGAGLFGCVFAYEAQKSKKTCLVVDKRPHIGGNIFTENILGINVHKYGPHIFHTNNKTVWDYVNNLADFNRFINSPLAYYKGKIYNLPFNMNTFYQLWGVITPEDAIKKIEEERSQYKHITNPKNLEEQALILVGKDIYNVLIKGYTEKQWGRPATQIPAFIIRRLPLRFTYDNNYFNDKYQGIPIGGYTQIIDKLLQDAKVRISTDYFKNKNELDNIANQIIYTGKIDEYYSYKFGKLEYRSLHFENELINRPNFQGNAVINFTDINVHFTRIIEHKHFDPSVLDCTYITKEYPDEFSIDKEPYYPINDNRNQTLYERYLNLALNEKNVFFKGRLGEYKYYDMHQIIEEALNFSKKILNNEN